MNAQDIVELLYKKGVTLAVEGDSLKIGFADSLDDGLLSAVKNNKADIISLLRKLDGHVLDVGLTKNTYPESYECMTSVAQQRILFMEELSNHSSYYNIPVAYRISGRLNKDALRMSLDSLVSKHDVLRSKYLIKEGVYIQHVCKPEQLGFTEISLLGDSNQESILHSILKNEAEYKFSLLNEWPIKVSLIQLKEDEYVLSINIHHVAADGWSARVIIEEINSAYRIFSSKPDEQLGLEVNLSFQYADYVYWLEQWKSTDEYLASRNYWLTELNEAPELHSLPTDFLRPTIQNVDGNLYRKVFSEKQSDVIQSCARLHKTTPFVIFQAIFAAFLARYSGESDIVFGTVTANRKPIEFINTVGLFVNTLALRYRIDNDTTLHNLIYQAIDVSERAFKFQRFPFDALVDELRPARSLGYSPLIQIMLVMQDGAANSLSLDGLTVVPIAQRQNVSKFDIALHVSSVDDKFFVDWEYNISLFKEATIKRMADHFELILNAISSFPEKKVHQLSLFQNINHLIYPNVKDIPDPRCIIELFEHHVAFNKDRIAIRDGSKEICYGELGKIVNNAANYLSKLTETEIKRVGVCSEKSTELLIALLAIFKMGATYVPLDPYYPKDRLDWMVNDSKIDLLLLGANIDCSVNFQVRTISLENLSTQSESQNNLVFTNDINAPAYIIYTSGSTGKPKGVLVSQKSLFYSLYANRTIMGITCNDLLPTIGSQAFGVSLLEILLPLISGGGVRIVRKDQVADIDRLVNETKDVTVLHAVPSLMRQWLDVITYKENVYPHLRLLLVGGEAVPHELLKKIKKWRPQIQLLELYGMTETTVVCSSYSVGNDLHSSYCIGKPHMTTYFFVLNEQKLLQPIGVPGELYIGGYCLASEYINQLEMTAERFIDNPFKPGEKLYRTGDRVKLLDDGYYEFLGRVDHQVSLRGARLELGEIESLALHVAGVKQAIAHVVQLSNSDKTLVLYFTAYDMNSNELPDRIRGYLVSNLPDYMCPTIIQQVDSFTLNPNGKVDRKKLPSLIMTADRTEPETNIEVALLRLWQEVLCRYDIGVTANFFEVGGHSLMASKLSTLIRKEFSIEFPLVLLFEFPTIRSCSKHIEMILNETQAESLVLDNGYNDLSVDELTI